jgi:hypothetical protein
MKNPFYAWLTPILAVGVTILGFLILKPEEPTAVYWINLIYSLCLVVLFFIWLKWGRWSSRSVDEQTLYFRVFLGVGTLYYIIAAVVWMLFFLLWSTETGQKLLTIHLGLSKLLAALPEPSVNIYLLGILLLTVLWIVIASIVGRHDVVYNTQQTALEQATDDVRAFVAELKEQAEQHQHPDTLRRWKALIREAESVPPARFGEQKDRLTRKAEELMKATDAEKNVPR